MCANRGPRRDLSYKLGIERKSIAMTGRCVLTPSVSAGMEDEEITSLAKMGVQPRLTYLDVSKTALTSFDSLLGQPWLEEIVADGSQVKSFEGLSRHPKLRSFSAIAAPISDIDTYRLLMLIVVGPKLAIINGTSVTRSERARAASYPKIAKHLVEAGWVPPEEDPTAKEYKKLAADYRVTIDGELDDEMLATAPVFIPKRKKEELEMAEKVTDDYTSFLQEQSEQSDEFLARELADVMRAIGISVSGDGGKMKEEIISAVSSLAGLAATLSAGMAEPKAENDEQTT